MVCNLVTSLNVAEGEFFRDKRPNMEATYHGQKMAVSVKDELLTNLVVKIFVNFDRKYSTDDNFNCARILMKKSPLYSLMPVFELDKNGVPISTIGNGEEGKKATSQAMNIPENTIVKPYFA